MSADDPKDDDSSGISLGDLPDETPVDEQTEALRVRTEAFKARKRWEKSQAQNQRAQTLAKLSDEDKLLAMTRQYDFDRREFRLWIVLLCFIPVALKYSDVFHLAAKHFDFNGDGLNVLGGMMAASLRNLTTVFRLGELYTAILLLVASPFKSTHLRFIVSFEGLELPLRLQSRSDLGETRQRVRWDEIVAVKAVRSVVPALQVFSHERVLLGELRWDLWKKDKRAFLKLLRRYVGDQHPLRKHVEQELS